MRAPLALQGESGAGKTALVTRFGDLGFGVPAAAAAASPAAKPALPAPAATPAPAPAPAPGEQVARLLAKTFVVNSTDVVGTPGACGGVGPVLGTNTRVPPIISPLLVLCSGVPPLLYC